MNRISRNYRTINKEICIIIQSSNSNQIDEYVEKCNSRFDQRNIYNSKNKIIKWSIQSERVCALPSSQICSHIENENIKKSEEIAKLYSDIKFDELRTCKNNLKRINEELVNENKSILKCNERLKRIYLRIPKSYIISMISGLSITVLALIFERNSMGNLLIYSISGGGIFLIGLIGLFEALAQRLNIFYNNTKTHNYLLKYFKIR